LERKRECRSEQKHGIDKSGASLKDGEAARGGNADGSFGKRTVTVPLPVLAPTDGRRDERTDEGMNGWTEG